MTIEEKAAAFDKIVAMLSQVKIGCAVHRAWEAQGNAIYAGDDAGDIVAEFYDKDPMVAAEVANAVNTVVEIQAMGAEDTGMYGRKASFADAQVTVTEFLDNFYDESEEKDGKKANYNQAFCELERRIQNYFGYERRDTENA